MNFKKPLVLSLMVYLSISAVGQIKDSIISVYGQIAHEDTRLAIRNSHLIVKCKKEPKIKLTLGQDGKFDFHLHSDRIYTVKVLSKGFVSKVVLVNTFNIPADSKISGFTMEIDFNIFEKEKGQKFPFLKKPMGSCYYDIEIDNMAWDMEEIMRQKERIQSIRERN